jgi:hypothetical protein
MGKDDLNGFRSLFQSYYGGRMVIEMRKKVFQRGLQAGAFMVPSI